LLGKELQRRLEEQLASVDLRPATHAAILLLIESLDPRLLRPASIGPSTPVQSG
jgi:hypothetical protein